VYVCVCVGQDSYRNTSTAWMQYGASAPVGNGYYNEGYCTAIDTTPRNYADSIDYCGTIGGWGNVGMMFTHITNDAVQGNRFIQHTHTHTHTSDAGVANANIASTLDADKKVWIGINDRDVEGTFHWTHANLLADGSVYLNWATGNG
jgi:hypothetical protein